MNIARLIIAAGLAASSLAAAGAADAQRYDRHSGYHQRHDGHRFRHGGNRGWRGYCHTEWRHHHRVRVCR